MTRSRIPGPSIGLVLSCCLLLGAAGSAVAAPSLRMALPEASAATGSDDGDSAPRSASLAGRLPVTGPFEVVVSFGKRSVDSAVLYVWPNALMDCTTGVARDSDPQSYVLPMSISTAGPAHEGRVQVPHLQVGRLFCFRVEWQEAMSIGASKIKPEILAEFEELPEKLAALVEGTPDLAALGRREVYGRELFAILKRHCKGGECRTGNTAGLVRALSDVTLRSGIIEIRSQLADLARAADAGGRALLAHLGGADNLPSLTIKTVARRYSGELARRRAPAMTEATLELWKEEIAGSKARAADRQAWRAWLDRLLAERAAYLTARDLVGPGKAPHPDRIAADEKWRAYLLESAQLPTIVLERSLAMTPAWAKTVAVKARPDELAEFLRAVQKAGTRPATGEWQSWLEEFERARQRHDAAVAKAKAAELGLQKKLGELENSYQAVVADYLADEFRIARVASAVGRREAPSSNNYVSIDIGFAVGSPDTRHVWVSQYAALNIYSQAVERELPLDAHVGSRTDWLRQHLALTFGLSTTSSRPLPGVSVEGLLGSAMPVIGLGVRLSPLMRMSALLFLYRGRSESPTSVQEFIGVTPSIGFSFDADIIQLLTKAL